MSHIILFQIIVSETQFAEGGGGRKHMMGSIVTDDGSVIGGSGLPNKFGTDLMELHCILCIIYIVYLTF